MSRHKHKNETLINEEGFGSIYKITNVLTGMAYIGQTKKEYIAARLDGHFCTARAGKTTSPMHEDMRKHDRSCFKLEILEAGIPYNQLHSKEIEYIARYNTVFPNGYNITRGGGGTLGFTPWNKGIPRSEETKRKISAKFTKERREAQRKRMLGENNYMFGKHQPGLHRFGSDNPFYGKHHSDETKKRIAESKDKKAVTMCDLNWREIQTFDSLHEAARYIRENTKFVKADHSFISKCVRNMHESAYGYKWKYKEV